MSIEQELKSLGFVAVGTISPDPFGKGCRVDLQYTAPERAVWVLVAESEVKMVGATTTLEKRMHGARNTINEVLVKGRHRDATEPFKRFAPKVVAAGREISIWARQAAADTMDAEKATLDDKFNPAWCARRRV